MNHIIVPSNGTLTKHGIFTLDLERTRLFDDAFRFYRTSTGWDITVYIATPMLSAKENSLAYQRLINVRKDRDTAELTGESVYRFGLTNNLPRRVIAIRFHLDDNLQIQSQQIDQSLITVENHFFFSEKSSTLPDNLPSSHPLIPMQSLIERFCFSKQHQYAWLRHAPKSVTGNPGHLIVYVMLRIANDILFNLLVCDQAKFFVKKVPGSSVRIVDDKPQWDYIFSATHPLRSMVDLCNQETVLDLIAKEKTSIALTKEFEA